MVDIRITYRASSHIDPCSETRGRPPVEFSTFTCPSGSTVTVTGYSKGGWVWTNVYPTENGQFDYLLVKGGSVELLSGFSDDDTICEFRVTHDGKSSEIVITWNTRAD